MKNISRIIGIVLVVWGLPFIAGAWYSYPPYHAAYTPISYTYSYSANQPGFYTYPMHSTYNYGNYPYLPTYVQNSYDVYPPTYYGGYPTGDAVPWIGGQMCYYSNYGRYPCSFDPHQYIYDPWTGSWY